MSRRLAAGGDAGGLVIQVVAPATTEAMLRDYAAADRRADVVELRLDAVRDLDLDRILAARGKPKLITVRSRRQGGGAYPRDRDAILRRVLRANVDYVDLEFGGDDLPYLKGPGKARRILSYHDFHETPADLQEVYRRMRGIAEGALIKIVTFADAASDILRVRDLLRAEGTDGRLIAFCMGPKGVPGRILARHWGSAAVYAAARGAPPTAPGQVPLEDLFDVYRFDRIGPHTRIFGVLGSPVSHSLSPRMHNLALALRDVDACYLPFEASTVGEFLPLLSELRVAGLSVTLPHKASMVPHLDRLDAVARRVGAVNTVVKTWNRLEGTNTDVEASVAPLRRRIDLRGRRVAVMGAGGAARALVHGLVREGAEVIVFNRTASRARRLAGEFGVRSRPWAGLRRLACDLLVNATSVGLAPGIDATPIPEDWIAAPLVYDIVYNPPETRFLREARRRGATAIDGVEMFVEQGAAQFRLFTGLEPPVGAMRESVLEALRSAPSTAGPRAVAPSPPGRPAASPVRLSAAKRHPSVATLPRRTSPAGARRSRRPASRAHRPSPRRRG